MENSNIQHGDFITDLPTNEVQLPPDDIQIIDSLFKNKSKDIMIILTEFKDCFIFALVCAILYTPFVNTFLSKVAPITEKSIIINFCTKLLIATILIWILKIYF